MMFSKFSQWMSLGGQFWLTSLLYIGIGSLLLAVAPDPPSAMADGTPYGECEDDETECGGECIPDTNVCCDDGTYGDSETCVCCTGCTESACYNDSTVACESDLPSE